MSIDTTSVAVGSWIKAVNGDEDLVSRWIKVNKILSDENGTWAFGHFSRTAEEVAAGKRMRGITVRMDQIRFIR